MLKIRGLSLSRIGIFRVDGNGYLVDDQANYVYGYALEDGTRGSGKTGCKRRV